MAKEQSWKDSPEQDSGEAKKRIGRILGFFALGIGAAAIMYACSGFGFFKGGLHAPLETLAENYYAEGGSASLRLDKEAMTAVYAAEGANYSGTLSYANGWIHIDLPKSDGEMPDASFFVRDESMIYYPGGDLFLYAAEEAES